MVANISIESLDINAATIHAFLNISEFHASQDLFKPLGSEPVQSFHRFIVQDKNALCPQRGKNLFRLTHTGIANVTTEIISKVSIMRDIERDHFVITPESGCIAGSDSYNTHGIAIFLHNRLPALIRL